MWNIITILLLAVEVVLLLSFAIGRLKKQNLNEAAVFMAFVFIVNLAMNLVPYLYNVMVLDEAGNPVFEVFNCIMASVHMFIGEGDGEAAMAFSEIVPLFGYVYIFAVVISVMATISAAIEAFGNNIRNYFRREKAMKKPSCDIVVGNSPKALEYAKTCNAILLLDDSISKETAVELIEEGYGILRKGFTQELFQCRQFNKATRYNVICMGDENALDNIDTFISYKKESTELKNIYLYVELEEKRAETIRREIIEKNGCEEWVTTFCTNELLARTFVEENPVTKYLPNECFEDASIKSNTQIHVFILGFNGLNRQIYRQSILNNQLVSFDDNTYKLLQVHYHICDNDVDGDIWEIDGLKEALGELVEDACFPLPELPFETEVIDKAPDSRAIFNIIKKQAQQDNNHIYVIIDTEDDCSNIEIGDKLKTMLFGVENYHIFVRSEAAFTENESDVTYFGKNERVLTHDVIVNESLSVMAKKVNEVYTAQYTEDEKKASDSAEYIRKKADEAWNSLDYFTLYSNIYSAMSLRVKLNLLGLDYIKDGSGKNVELIKERHQHKREYEYSSYFEPSARNALIAQEHARWNAYHLLNEWLPMEKNSITAKPYNGEKVSFNLKNSEAKKHSCLTTYKGLDSLSTYLAQKAGGSASAKDYDYYVYDEMLINSAEELLKSLGYSVIEK